MYHISKKSTQNIIGIQYVDRVTADDYATLVPFLKGKLQEYRDLRLVCDLMEFKSISFRGILADMSFGLKYFSRVEKMAMIGSKLWIKRLTNMVNVFYGCEIKYFSSEEVDKAWEWIKK